MGKMRPPLPSSGAVPLPRWIGVARDPEQYWSEVGRHVLHNVNEYAGYARRKDLTPFQAVEKPDDLLRTGEARVYTPEELVAACAGAGAGATLRFNPLEGGIPPEIAWRSLRLFEEEVLPHLPQ